MSTSRIVINTPAINLKLDTLIANNSIRYINSKYYNVGRGVDFDELEYVADLHSILRYGACSINKDLRREILEKLDIKLNQLK